MFVFAWRNNAETLLANHRNEQVIAPFLIILRVANRNAVTSATAVSGSVSSIHFRSREKLTDGVSLPGRDFVSSMDTSGNDLNELCVGTETTVDVLHHD